MSWKAAHKLIGYQQYNTEVRKCLYKKSKVLNSIMSLTYLPFHFSWECDTWGSYLLLQRRKGREATQGLLVLVEKSITTCHLSSLYSHFHGLFFLIAFFPHLKFSFNIPGFRM